MNELPPPPSLVELVTSTYDGDKSIDKSKPDSIWKKWFSQFHTWALENMNKDFFFEVVAGNVKGHTAENVVGHDNAIITSLSTIGLNTGLVATHSTTADIDSISSENVGDTHDIWIKGVDVNYVEVEQTVTLNGQSRVALNTPLMVVNCMSNLTATPTLGVIWVYVNTAIVLGKPTDLTKIRSSITRVLPAAGATYSNERCTSTIKAVPAGKTAYIVFGKTTVTDNKAMELTFWVTPEGGVPKLTHHIDIKNNNYDYFFKTPGKVLEKSIIEVRASIDVGSAEISANYDIVYKDN